MTTASVQDPGGRRERVTAADVERLVRGSPAGRKGVRVLHDVQFANAVFVEPVSFENVEFEGTTRFDEALFEADASFSGATFTGTARFDRATFGGSASFRQARFMRTLWFNQVSAGEIHFDNATFEGDATFDATECRRTASWMETLFRGDASFDLVSVRGSMLLRAADFEADASFNRMKIGETLDVRGTIFAGNASFAGVESAGVSVEGARFDRNPELPGALLDLPDREPVRFVAKAAADAPSDTDELGFEPRVRALHALLDDRSTTLPMAIAITAPWGMGKSSMMMQLKKLLAHPPPSPEPYRRWSTVDFPAWKFERSERLWAGLAKAIYEQPLEDMGFRKGLAFRWRLERKRLGFWKLLLKFGWPVVAAGAAVAILLNADLSKAGTTAAGLATLAAIAAGVSRYWDAVSNPFKQAIERYASTPDYEAQLGFTSAADEDIRALGEALCPDERDAVAVFVDDLDRCRAEHVVEVVEAMNQIFASERDRPYVFVLGLDREMVSTSIRVAYRDVVDELAETNAALADAFGTQFLSKLVQLSMTIPPPADARLVQLLESVGAQGDQGDAPSEREIERVEDDLRQDGATLEGLAETARQTDERPEANAAVQEAVSRQAVSAIRESPDVFAAEVAALRHLDRNPRQVKRFHNAFRLQLYVANFDPERRFDFRPDHLHALAKWVALRLRWPELADDDDREPLLLGTLEAHFNSEVDRLPPQDDLDYLKATYHEWFEGTPALRKVLFEHDPDRRISALPRDAFVETA